MHRESWTWIDSRTRKRVSAMSSPTREFAEKTLRGWLERDAKGGRPDLHDLMPYVEVVRVPDHLWGSRPGDVIPPPESAGQP